MSDRRMKDTNWAVCDEAGKARSVEHAQLAVLMDIRDQLQEQTSTLSGLLNLLQCRNVRLGFIAMKKLRSHMENVMPRRKKRKKHRAVVVRRKR